MAIEAFTPLDRAVRLKVGPVGAGKVSTQTVRHRPKAAAPSEAPDWT